MHVVLASAFAGHVSSSPEPGESGLSGTEHDDASLAKTLSPMLMLVPYGTSPVSHVKHNPYALRYSVDVLHDSTHEPFHDVYPALHLHCVFTQPPIIRFPVGAFAVLQIELYVEFSGHNND